MSLGDGTDVSTSDNEGTDTAVATNAGIDTGTPRLPEAVVLQLREIAARYPQPRSALLPMLHLAQSTEGFVTSSAIETCAWLLEMTPAEVSAVATFYTMYKRRPIGDYHVGVCTNTLCAIMGGDLIFDRLREHLGIGNDETTEDGKITLEHVECNAACDYAPVMMVNWEFFDNQTPESAVQVVDALRDGQFVTATRGPRVSTWREAERVLAGYHDDRSDEGPAAGPASLAGLRIAHEKGWTAPQRPDGNRDGRGSAVGAAEQADTHRAESETKLAESQPGGPSSDAATNESGKEARE